MATPPLARLLFMSLLTISILLSPSVSLQDHDFIVDLKQTTKPLRQKSSQFRVYWHDVVSGNNATSVPIVKPPNPNNGFGMISMIDNPLTLGPDLGSQLVGRAEGFYGVASQREVGLIMNMNFVFHYGKYNGSTISILGRNSVFNKVREMPVVGGSGLFRFATGYAEARTHWFDIKTGDATVEYTVRVLHY